MWCRHCCRNRLSNYGHVGISIFEWMCKRSQRARKVGVGWAIERGVYWVMVRSAARRGRVKEGGRYSERVVIAANCLFDCLFNFAYLFCCRNGYWTMAMDQQLHTRVYIYVHMYIQASKIFFYLPCFCLFALHSTHHRFHFAHFLFFFLSSFSHIPIWLKKNSSFHLGCFLGGARAVVALQNHAQQTNHSVMSSNGHLGLNCYCFSVYFSSIPKYKPKSKMKKLCAENGRWCWCERILAQNQNNFILFRKLLANTLKTKKKNKEEEPWVKRRGAQSLWLTDNQNKNELHTGATIAEQTCSVCYVSHLRLQKYNGK